MKLKRLAVLAGCAMWMVSVQAAERGAVTVGQLRVYSVAAGGALGDARSFVQRVEAPREVNPVAAATPLLQRRAAATTPMPSAAASSIPEPPSLWLMLLGLVATGIALTRRRFD